jgi:hypothetical protein
MIAISGIDNDGYSRHSGLLSLRTGDQIMQLGTNNSQNYQTWSVTSVTDQGTWVQIGIQVLEAGSAFVTPGMNQTRLIQALQVVAQETAPPGETPQTSAIPGLASPDDIVSRLGRNLNQIEAARVDAMIQDGSAIIRSEARNSFMYSAQDEITMVASDGIFTLPGRPIYNIISVTARSGISTIPSMPITWFVFDGVDTVTIPEPSQSGIINLPTYWYEDISWYSYSYDVVYEHGYVTVPPEVKGLLCSAIISELATPTQSATIQSEAIGAYSYSMRRREGGSGVYAALIDFGMKDIMADYRFKNGSIPVRRSLCHIQRYRTARR